MSVIRSAPPFAFIALSFFFALTAQSADRDVQVLRYENISVDFRSTQIASATRSAPAASAMRFAAFGKNYSLNLEPNTRIKIPAASHAQAYRGAVDGRDKSWVRITRVGDEIHGLLFDGTNLLAIEPASTIASDAEGTAIFRLADTKADVGANFCSASDAPIQTGLDMYRGLGAESKSIMLALQASGATTRLEMSALMDIAFRGRYSTDADANDAIIARVNNVDGIFTSQLGVEVAVTQIVQPETQGQPIFTSTSPNTLLQAVSKLRSFTPTLYATGTTHLFTGIDMDGSTVGISYINMICSQQYSASLSEARDRGVWFDSLVAAHELGHTFGSPHDGEGQCATTPQTFLMAPTINGSSQFSQCSLGIMQARIQTASCLVPIPLADISLPASLGEYHAGQNQSFNWSVAVSNIGNTDAATSQVQIVVPAALTVTAAVADGGSCSTGAGTVSCDLGTVAAHAVRNVQLTLIGAQAGTYSVAASVNSATTDIDTSNNSSTGTIRIDPTVDVAVSMNVPSTATADQSITGTFSVTNKSATAAPNLSVDIVLPPGMVISGAAQFGGSACQVQFQTIQCATSSLAANGTMTGTLTIIPHDAGSQTITATLDGAYVDSQPQDNIAQNTISVAADPTPLNAVAPQSTPKSGGGAVNSYLLLAIMSFAIRQRISRRVQIRF